MDRLRLAVCTFAILLVVATTGLLGVSPVPTGSFDSTECRQCMQACPSSGFCWCAGDWCGDVCSSPPECETTIE